MPYRVCFHWDDGSLTHLEPGDEWLSPIDAARWATRLLAHRGALRGTGWVLAQRGHAVYTADVTADGELTARRLTAVDDDR